MVPSILYCTTLASSRVVVLVVIRARPQRLSTNQNLPLTFNETSGADSLYTANITISFSFC